MQYSTGTLALMVLSLAAVSPAAAQMPANVANPPNSFTLPEWPLTSAPAMQNDASASTGANGSTYAKAPSTGAADRTPYAIPPQIAENVSGAGRYDDGVGQASFETSEAAQLPAQAQPDDRHLAPRGDKKLDGSSRAGRPSAAQLARGFGLRFDSMYSTISALVFVLGLFFVSTWALRRGGRKKASALPITVVSVLGRVALAPKQFAELLRIGNKLVLVALTPDGAKTLTEVTDPAEVDRLTGLCQQHDPHSPGRAFEKMFRELANDRAPEGFLGNEAPVISVAPHSPAYLSRGGAAGV